MTRSAVLVSRFHVVQDRLTARLAAALRRYFEAQAARIVRAYLASRGHKALAEEFSPPSDDQALWNLLRPYLAAMLLESSRLAARMVGIDHLAANDPAAVAIASESAQRVRWINDETRRAIQRVLADGMAAGYGPRQIAQGVPRDNFRGLRDTVREVYAGRAETIARTELATINQQAASERYRAAGVTQVLVHDGPECGLIDHDDDEKPNGRRYDLGYIGQWPIAHPNCRRVWIPVGRAA